MQSMQRAPLHCSLVNSSAKQCILPSTPATLLLPQVNAAKAALEVALTRATQQRSAYEPYRDMARFDHQLDLASLVPAYKATCALAAKALTGEKPPSTSATGSGRFQRGRRCP